MFGWQQKWDKSCNKIKNSRERTKRKHSISRVKILHTVTKSKPNEQQDANLPLSWSSYKRKTVIKWLKSQGKEIDTCCGKAKAVRWLPIFWQCDSIWIKYECQGQTELLRNLLAHKCRREGIEGKADPSHLCHKPRGHIPCILMCRLIQSVETLAYQYFIKFGIKLCSI
jgi:hypothetical protein